MDQMSRDLGARNALLKVIAYFDAIDYAPTWAECSSWVEWSGASGFEQIAPPNAEELVAARDALVSNGSIATVAGRYALPPRIGMLASMTLERTQLFARKVRRARRVTRWLLRFSGVRFVALANTTALEHARHRADLDFFVIVRKGSLWSTRLGSAGLYRILGKLARAEAPPDAVCLSYFITDDALDLGSHMLPMDDPYFRYWFLSLLPLYDDGVSHAFWQANAAVHARHPRALPWIVPPDLAVRKPIVRIPTLPFIESLATRVQMSWFPANIKERMNTDTSVIVSDSVLKFHTDDARARFRTAYQERLNALGLT